MASTLTHWSSGLVRGMWSDVHFALIAPADHWTRRAWQRLVHPYPHRLLFVAGLPKSGTEWMNALLLRIPGYARAPLRDPQGLFDQHRLNAGMLRSLPRFANLVLKSHVEATPDCLAALAEHHVAAIIMWRDLRDQAVSRYYHILSDVLHRHHRLYRQLPREDGISHSVSVTLDYFVPWVENWRRAMADDPERYLLVRYEDLRTQTRSVFRSVLDFYRIRLDEPEIDRILDTADADTKQGTTLSERLKKGTTFRAGRVGDWRTHFSARDVEAFKTVAGRLLIDLGYESDESWTAYDQYAPDDASSPAPG